MRPALNAIITTFLLLLFSNFAQAEKIFDGDVKILSSDESGITFTYFVPDVVLTNLNGYPDNFKYPQISRTAQNRYQGQPLLPIKFIPIGVPYNSKPTVTVLSQHYNNFGKSDVPNFEVELSSQDYLSRTANRISSEKDWPSRTAFIFGEEMLRGLRVIKIGIAAAKIENGTLYKGETITVRVDFNSTKKGGYYPPRPVGQIFENILPRIIANYDISKNWRIYWPPIPLKTQTSQSVFDSSLVWVKLEVTSAGIYKISRYELSNAGVSIDEVNPQQIRIFYGGGAELPFDNDEPKPQLYEIPIYIIGEDDGEFDSADQILFYAQATDRFKYSPDDSRFVFHHNHYTSKNVYWLTYGGSFVDPPKRWAEIDGSLQEPYDYAVTSFDDFIHDEREVKFYQKGTSTEYYNYFEWYWGWDTTFTSNIQLFDAVTGSEALVVVEASGGIKKLLVNNVEAELISSYDGIFLYSSTNFRSGFNMISVSDTIKYYLDYIDVHYNRLLYALDNQLMFSSPDSPGLIEYRLTNVPSDYMLLDISSPDSVSMIVNAELSGSELKFHHYNSLKRLYYLAHPSRYKIINSYSLYEPVDLKSTSNRADYVIITHGQFYQQALELATHRESVSPDITVMVVDIEDVYNQFSWGLFDPMAIRDFLKYAYENWSGAPPGYVMLVGDGHFDYRNNLGVSGRMFIPPFEAPKPNYTSASASDDNYVYFGQFGDLDYDDSGSIDMIIGRLPVNSTNQMDIVVEKIINYEANPTMGKWRNNIIIAADDNFGAGMREAFHTNQAESLAELHVPKNIEVQKIYMLEYPIRAGRTKPDAREALINAINDGGLIVNWIGHGNKGLWAHEILFRRVEDMPLLHNHDKLPMILAASCSAGFFDDPNEQGMSEDFTRFPGGGAITSIGATRPVNAGQNAALNREVFDQLLFSDSTAFGQALYIAKFLRGSIDNDRGYLIFGDPALIAGKPSLEAQFTYRPDSLKGLTIDSISGEIYQDSLFVSDFNGTVWVLVKDASINRHKALTNYAGVPLYPPAYVDYILPGPTIFNGPAEVSNGQFSTSFFIPKDITYTGNRARIYVYFENGFIDGSGVVDSISIAGGISAEVDSVGPTIEIIYNGKILNNSITAVSANAVFETRLFDPHGINITGSMGHGIVVKIDDGDNYSEDITDNFTFDMGDWQQGSATFEISDIPEGEHQLSLKAWDNYNNSSLFIAVIRVYQDECFSIKRVMNYPNPVVRADSTVFQYMLTGSAERVSLKIFSLSGRKVKSFNLTGTAYTTEGYKYIPYYLRDDDGDRLASGVYIYRIEAIGTGVDGVRRKSNFQSKLVILR